MSNSYSLWYSLNLYDGVCDVSNKIDRLSGEMKNMEDKWVYSSSGRNMFISFDIGRYGPNEGFEANIHKGIESKILSSPRIAKFLIR